MPVLGMKGEENWKTIGKIIRGKRVKKWKKEKTGNE